MTLCYRLRSNCQGSRDNGFGRIIEGSFPGEGAAVPRCATLSNRICVLHVGGISPLYKVYKSGHQWLLIKLFSSYSNTSTDPFTLMRQFLLLHRMIPLRQASSRIAPVYSREL
jgi:hypothetical protein